MGSLEQFLKTTKTDCKKLHDDWSGAKEASEKAWSKWKKDDKNKNALRAMETEYKKLKFNEKLGPTIDKLHEEDDAAGFNKRAEKILWIVGEYQQQLKQAQLPEGIEKPLKDALAATKKKVEGIAKQAEQSFDQEEIEGGKSVSPFNIVEVDFAERFKKNDAWAIFDDAPEMKVIVTIKSQAFRREIARHKLSVSDLQKEYNKHAADAFVKSTAKLVQSELDRFSNDFDGDITPDVKSNIELKVLEFQADLAKEIAQALTEKIKIL